MTLALLIPLLPLASFLAVGLTGLFGGPWRNRGHHLAVPATFASLLLSVIVCVQVMQGERVTDDLYTWMLSGGFHASIGVQLDPLTAVMLVLVTLVSSLVHLYSIGYMRGDRGYDRFFAYLGLFTFSMVMLVLSNNFLQLYFFWEAVGLCSYLLIAHWYERPSACNAATKAFVVNRVGDFGFGLGVLLIFRTFGALDFQTVFGMAPAVTGLSVNLLHPLTGVWGAHWDVGVVTLISLLLFAGAIGKSAQLPLHTWLPDAMEGPTPISALIHAATMVTAGVFMVARVSPLLSLSPPAMAVVATIGGATALFAASIALTQTDIKRIVAYSTVSQLGYMMMACGVGAFGAGIFHLLTHGAFKALLFLGCGSVIHALANEQDLRRMGGLRSHLPVTYLTFLTGVVALAGLPPFAGFFSKDEILWAVFQVPSVGAKLLWLVGLVTAGLTAFYAFRLFYTVFHGPSKVTPELAGHLHESPSVMTVPLIVLGVLSVSAGWIGLPEGAHGIGGFLSTVAGFAPRRHGGEDTVAHVVVVGLSVAAAVIGWGVAYVCYVKRPELPAAWAERWTTLYELSRNKWYVDELYDRLFVRPTVALARALWRGVDVRVIDGVVNGIAGTIRRWGQDMQAVQSGQLQHYALFMACGLAVLVGLYLFW
ncbi:MAG TPA: NADH-quinone oxidoreductase subunit L [Nitrospiria bacterium]|nr:NADH-quinone oxidoreductase subunit L [Nitrospiria bacterium]